MSSVTVLSADYLYKLSPTVQAWLRDVHLDPFSDADAAHGAVCHLIRATLARALVSAREGKVRFGAHHADDACLSAPNRRLVLVPPPSGETCVGERHHVGR